MHFHSTACFNYTTYDLRRDQDFVNVNQHNRCVMVSMPGATPHLWQYARILKIFHVNTTFTDKDPKKKAVRTNVLWVQWAETDDTWAFGAQACRLERLQYIDKTSEDACAFLDPDMVICAFHMQPVFVTLWMMG
jgi:hypothetical protein